MSMSPDTMPGQEAEPRGEMLVRRLQLTGFNRFGRPSAEEIATQTFLRRKEAFAWIIEGTGYHHEVEFPFIEGQSISAQLIGDRRDPGEILVVEAFGKRVLSPRSVEGHYGVSTDYETFFDIIFMAGDYDADPIFDRGLAWLMVQDPSNPTLRFVLKPNQYTQEELEEGVERLNQRITEIFQNLLNGYLLPITLGR